MNKNYQTTKQNKEKLYFRYNRSLDGKLTTKESNILITDLAIARMLSQARHVFNNMKYRDVYTYNRMINAYSKVGNCEEAIKLLREMITSGVTPDVITYSAAISACEKAGKWEKQLSYCER